MADSTLALLGTVRALLQSNPPVAAIVGPRVYTAVPVKPTYPFMLITAESQPYATDTFTGMEHRLRVQAFARENKAGTVLALRAAAFAALNRNEAALAVPGLVLVENDGMMSYFPEGDGKTYQSVVDFKVLVN